VQEDKLTGDEAERLKTLASHYASTFAFNALMVFGATAVSAGILALSPSFAAGAALGIALVLVGRYNTNRAGAASPRLAAATGIPSPARDRLPLACIERLAARSA
jgi:hypothetical protein